VSKRRPRLGFVLEQTLGHVTHSKNLQDIIGNDHTVSSTFVQIPFSQSDRSRWVPGYSNWTIRAGHRTRQAMRRLGGRHEVDTVFIHTQVLAVFTRRQMRTLPTVVSIDATPSQYDSLGPFYAHKRASDPVEWFKRWLNRSTFARAAHVVSWSDWGKESLIAEYGVPESKVTVIPPGVQVGRWSRPDGSLPPDEAVVRVLFVGGDLERKGGAVLLQAMREVRTALGGPGPRIEVHLVTGAAVPPEEGVFVHSGLQPNSPELIELYHRAHIFCLPTLGDCLPMVLSEAGAAGLPLVSTRVGAIPEIVRDGETGLLVESGDVHALAAALSRLIANPALRHDLGSAAARLVRERFDAERNAHQLVQLMYSISGAPR
jgi:glycosyltransferase involved in cell wall biosynthesis